MTLVLSWRWRAKAARQPEQQINLDNVVLKNAAIRIPKHRWKANNIKAAVEKILANPSYKENTIGLQKKLLDSDGQSNVAKAIWEFINTRLF